MISLLIGRVIISFCLNSLLRDCHKRVSFHHSVALVHVDAGNGSRGFCIDVVLHLHGFENDNRIACVHLVAYLYLDFVDGTRQRGYHWFARGSGCRWFGGWCGICVCCRACICCRRRTVEFFTLHSSLFTLYLNYLNALLSM